MGGVPKPDSIEEPMLASICLAASGIRAVGLKFKVLLESRGRARRRHYFVALQGYLAHHDGALPIVTIRLVGVRRDALVEGGDGAVESAGICQHCASVEVISCSIPWIHLCRLVIGLHGIVDFARLAESLSHVVVIRRQAPIIVGIFLGGGLHVFLLDINALR